jgi:fibronectin type 3 domain-containing protein
MTLPRLRCAGFDIQMRLVAQLLCAIAGPILAAAPGAVAQTDLSSQYLWQPVRIGGGGFVVGMVIHPLDPAVRYARTDVGNAYRWDNLAQQWIPMRVSNSDGTGVQSASETDAPSSYGEDSVAVDPTNTNVVYMVFPSEHSCDVQCPTNFVEIYKSTDGGQTFTPGNMTAAQITGNPNGPNRADGEKLAVDPGNHMVLYYGSDSQGLYRSLDDGMTWTQFGTGSSSGLPTNVEFVNVQFAKGTGTVTVNGVVVSKVIYAISINNSGDSGGDVYESSDGGQTWVDISTGVMDAASGESLTHQALSSSIDATDSLYVVENSATNGGLRAYWKLSSGKWTRVSLQGSINQPLTSVAVNPTNAQQIYAMGADTSLARSDDAGATWVNLGSPEYANQLGWLPQTVGMSSGEWHSNGGLKVDSAGNLWSPTGQEGTITIAAASASSATTANPPKWTIVSTGIEEMVAMDIAVPPGSSDTIIATAMDTTGFYIPNPDNFSAMQIPLQQEIISQGTSVAYAPDAPSYVAVTSSNVGSNGTNYSGYSTNGGITWTRFNSMPQFSCGGSKCDIPAGMIAISTRGTRTLGSDHIVIYPPESFAPQYSQDGGATWHVTASFPLNADGLTINTTDYSSFLYPQINQHLLRADPFTPDKFYLKFTHAPDSLYISTDGGMTWQGKPNANLPDWAWYGQLAVNGNVQNDLWYADGWAGSTVHGLFHSTDGGQTFQQIPEISHAIVVAAGAGSAQAGDAPYTVYFYGLMTSSPQWGIFRSTDGGGTWNRISYYPTGIYDVPHVMAASQDTFGKVYVGFSGNSFVYGQIVTNGTSPPGASTELSALAISAAEIDLSWMAPSGSVTGYNVYRGTSSGGESATPVASGVTTTAYADTAVTAGTKYYYKVAAVNANGQGPDSNEASATATQPSIALTAAAGGSTSATVSAGQTATYQLALASTNVSGVITFSCTGAPAGDTCTVPAPVNMNPTITSTSVSVSVHTSSLIARTDGPWRRGLSPLAAAAFILPFCFRRRRRFGFALIILLAPILAGLVGCGSGSTSTTPPSPVTSTLNVSASGQNVKMATISLTLTVE